MGEVDEEVDDGVDDADKRDIFVRFIGCAHFAAEGSDPDLFLAGLFGNSGFLLAGGGNDLLLHMEGVIGAYALHQAVLCCGGLFDNFPFAHIVSERRNNPDCSEYSRKCRDCAPRRPPPDNRTAPVVGIKTGNLVDSAIKGTVKRRVLFHADGAAELGTPQIDIGRQKHILTAEILAVVDSAAKDIQFIGRGDGIGGSTISSVVTGLTR